MIIPTQYNAIAVCKRNYRGEEGFKESQEGITSYLNCE